MKRVLACTFVAFALSACTSASAGGGTRLAVHNGRIVHMAKPTDQRAGRPQHETVSTETAATSPGEHRVTVKDGRIVYIRKR